MDEITELIERLIKEYKDQDSARDAFNGILAGDEELRNEYSEWCAAMGYAEKKGFDRFYQEYVEREDSIWDSMYPNREEYNDEFDKE